LHHQLLGPFVSLPEQRKNKTEIKGKFQIAQSTFHGEKGQILDPQ
jgi:hypothetical protein